MAEDYLNKAEETRDKLNAISPSMCMAKWLQVSLHLPQGRTHSCYHPPTHHIPLHELKKNPNALHNTQFKMNERKQMKEGLRPEGCQYCWNVEDAPNAPEGGRLSDRHYRSSEWWVRDAWDEVVNNPWNHDIKPRYVEVNFNQACNFKCSYCSPHLSTAWENDIKKHGGFRFTDGGGHNDTDYLEKEGLMPLDLARKDNPYIEAFWKWFPEVYDDLRIFRMTGGEPLMDKNTFKVLDYIDKNPNPNLEISLTTNMCPPSDEIFENFLNGIKKLERSIVHDSDDETEFMKITDLLLEPKNYDYRNVVFYVPDPKDGSHWETWKQYMIAETLHGLTAEEIQPDTEVISYYDIKHTFENVGHCLDENDNSFTYVNSYKRNKSQQSWEHIYYNVKCKHISIFISLDSTGAQAEYIRDGLDWEKLRNNVDRLLSETKRVSVTFINTFNLLSIPNLYSFLNYILELRQKFGYEHQKENNHKMRKQRVWFDIPYLRYPDWMTIQLADEKLLKIIEENIEFIKQNVLSAEEYSVSYAGFKAYEVLKLERNLAWAKESVQINENDLTARLIRFYEYFMQYDERRNLNFLDTFPELEEFWDYVADLQENSQS